MKLRSLIVETVVRFAGEAKLKAVKTLGDAAAVSLRGLDQAAESMAKGVERSAARTAAAMRDIGDAARAVQGASRLGEPRGAAAPRVRDEGLAAGRAANKQATRRPPKGGDDLDRAIAAANKQAASAAAAAAKHAATKASAESKSSAMNAGLAAGSVGVRDATAALGGFASKTEQVKARISDLTAQVHRNRKETVALKEQTIKTGDADGTLAARMTGLSVATTKTQIELSKAKRELTALNGGLIATIKSTVGAKVTVAALGHAFGNMLSNAVSGSFNTIKGAISGSVEKAMEFETALVGISKVARGADDTAEGFSRIKAGISATSKELGVLPVEVANLTAQLAPAFSDVKEGANGVAVDIVALTKDVSKVAVAWDMTGKEAGKAFAEISAGLHLTTDQTKSLFGGINEIGNQLGVNAGALAQSVQRSAGVLKGANISGETGAALSAVLLKTGSSAEIAATGVRTFITRLGAGETKGQLKAFETLNLDMKELRRNLANGDAEGQIKKVVAALGGLKNEERLQVMTEMFGTESIGSLGAAATESDLLGRAMEIMGDKTAAATSVQAEFDRVQNTSAAKVAKLKANIEVLAISFGERLLPYVDKLTTFLTSPEGQEWAAGAVEKAAGFVTTLASAIGTAVGFFMDLADSMGSATGAATALGVVVGGLAMVGGPFALAGAAAAAVGYGMAAAFDSAAKAILGKGDKISAKMLEIMNLASDIRHQEHTEEMKAANDEIAANEAGNEAHTKIRDKAAALADRYQKAELKKLGKHATEAQKLAVQRRAGQLQTEVEYGGGNRTLGSGMAEDRLGAFEKLVDSRDGGGATRVGGRRGGASDEARWAYLDRNRKHLKYSEKQEYNKLTKELDKAKTTGSGGDTWTAEQKRLIAEQKRIAGGQAGSVIDFSRTGHADRLGAAGKFSENARMAAVARENPLLAQVLTQGREVDKTGKLAGAGNILDKTLETRAEHLPGMNAGVSGSRGSSATAPPAMSNTYDQRVTNNNNIHFEQDITSTSDAPSADGRLRAAGRQVHAETLTGIQEAMIVFTGGPR